MDSVVTRWNGGRRFVTWDESGHSFVMDAKKGSSGDGTGMRPLQVVLSALAGCTGIGVVGILEKQRQDVRDVEIRVTGEQREEHPKMYVKIHVEYIVSGSSLKPESVARAVQLSEDKYCSVRGMMAPEVDITSEWRIEEA